MAQIAVIESSVAGCTTNAATASRHQRREAGQRGRQPDEEERQRDSQRIHAGHGGVVSGELPGSGLCLARDDEHGGEHEVTVGAQALEDGCRTTHRSLP